MGEKEVSTLVDDLATELCIKINKIVVLVFIIGAIILYFINSFLILIPLIGFGCWVDSIVKETKRIDENTTFQKEIWRSDTGIKLSFDYEDKRERRTILLHKIIEYEKEYREELRYYDKEIEDLNDEISKLDKQSDDYELEKAYLKEQIKDSKKQRKECVKSRKDYPTEIYFSGTNQDKNDLRLFNLRDIYNFADANGKELSIKELAENLGDKKLYKIFEEYGIF